MIARTTIRTTHRRFRYMLPTVLPLASWILLQLLHHHIIMSTSKQRWFPLESNPSLMNEYVSRLGLDTSLLQFCDVYSTEDWALEMIPQPVSAVIMLYPLTEKQESYQDDTLASKEQLNNVWFIKQRIGNACGTIGLLHAIMNVPPHLKVFQEKSWLANFQHDCPIQLDPIAKAQRLEQDETIATLHDQATNSESNATPRGSLDEDIITHFIAFVHVEGQLYELDGRKDAPVWHGPTTQETLLYDACKVVSKFMQRDPDEMRFTILALAPKLENE